MADASASHPPQQPYVGVQFKCCNVYSHVYINHDHTAYSGHCPRCASRVEIPIVAEGGSSGIFFTNS